MVGDFAAWVAEFKRLDLERADGELSSEQARRWVTLKDAIEHATSHEACPPSSKRGSIRVPADYEASFEDADGFRDAYLRNISEGGVYIASGNAFKMGDRFILRMRVKTSSVDISQSVQVVWVNANPSSGSGLEPGVGVAFLDLDPEKKALIKAVVHGRLDEIAKSL